MQTSGSRAVRVFVLDDHDIVRRGLLDLLSKRDISVVGEAGSATQATRRILELRPDVMLLDVQLQDGSGVQVCRDIRAQDPSIQGLLLTSAGDEESMLLSVLAGAAGGLAKLSGATDIVDAVRRVGTGRPLREQAEVERVADRLRARADSLDPPLTAQEAEVLSLLLAGHTDQEIALERQQPLTLVRDEVTLLISRLMMPSFRVDQYGRGSHRPDG